MRNAFAESLIELFKKDSKRILLVGDIGNRLFDNLKFNSPNSFLNCGISEANMTGVAAGLALCGYRPITYTITPFNTLKCIEQIKIDICYQNLPVTIVGTGSGLSYSSFGITHQSLDDLAIMKTMPNLTILCPSTPNEVRMIIKNLNKIKGPVYIRLGKKGEKEYFKKFSSNYNFLKPYSIIKGSEICILNIGHALEISYDLANLINSKKKMKKASLYNLTSVKPINVNFLKKISRNYKKIFIIEEHGRQGSIFESISSIYKELDIHNLKVYGVNTPDKINSCLGSQRDARSKLNLDPYKIAKKYKLI